MNVAPIGYNQQNSQQNFTGYIGKDVLKIISTTSNNCIKNEIQSIKKIDIKSLELISNTRENILQKLNNFVSQLHKDTYLTLDDKKTTFVFKNKKLNNVTYYNTPDFWKNEKIFTKDDKKDVKTIDLTKLTKKHLKKMEEFADKLEQYYTPKEIDKGLFNEYTDNIIGFYPIFEKLILRIKARKADKLAPEFGQPTGWLEKINIIWK